MRHCGVGHREEQHVAERRRFPGGSGARLAAQARRERLVVLEIERGEHHLVSGLDPDSAQRAADPARADDADFQRRTLALREPVGQGAQGEARRGAAQEIAPILPDSENFVHRKPPDAMLAAASVPRYRP